MLDPQDDAKVPGPARYEACVKKEVVMNRDNGNKSRMMDEKEKKE